MRQKTITWINFVILSQTVRKCWCCVGSFGRQWQILGLFNNKMLPRRKKQHWVWRLKTGFSAQFRLRQVFRMYCKSDISWCDVLLSDKNKYVRLCVCTGQESQFTIRVDVMESPTCFSHPSSLRLSFTPAANQHLKGSFDTEKESEGGTGRWG